jgi:hypothetical protein
MIKEAEEEASLRRDIAEKCIESGMISFFHRSKERGNIADLEYVFDIELPSGIIPLPKDGEVEEFYLWDINKVDLSIYENMTVFNYL